MRPRPGAVIGKRLALLGLARFVSASVIAQFLAVFASLLLALSPFLPQHQPFTRFGAANAVTLLRAGIVALFAGLLGPTAPIPNLAWLLAALAAAALLLDGVDGWLARRSGMQSSFGARFDMEVDAFFILILAALAWQFDKAGGWVLLSGASALWFRRAGFRWLPWLNQPLPPRRRRQTVCVIQTAVLAPDAAADSALVNLLAASALGLLAGALFAVDVRWLWRQPLSRPSSSSNRPHWLNPPGYQRRSGTIPQWDEIPPLTNGSSTAGSRENTCTGTCQGISRPPTTAGG